jgi:hypothetical protein
MKNKLKLEKLYREYDLLLENKMDINQITKKISQLESLILEDTSATGGPAAGASVGSVGTSLSNATTAGMGGVVSPQASAFPGALNGTNWINSGGTSGSGDISVPYNPSGKNRVFQKIKNPMSKSHGALTGKKSREKKIDLKSLRDLFNKKDSTTGKKVMNFSDFEKSKLDKVTKI